MNTKRFLITTADERSWKFDRPVLFLGEWCRLYDRKNIWRSMEGKVPEPFGLGKGQKEKDRLYLHSLIEQLLSELTFALNEFHQTDHDQRYWNIVLGQWLQRFVYVAFNRYYTLKIAIENDNVNGTVLFDLKEYKLATTNTTDFIWALYDNVWNHFFYSKVIAFLGTIDVEYISINEKNTHGFVQEVIFKPEPKFKLFIRNTLNKFLKKFSKNSDAFMINTYLPVINAIELNFRLKQIPMFWSSSPGPRYLYNKTSREQITFDTDQFQGFEKFVRSILAEAIPTCFVEGYSELIGQCRSLSWPANPKFIFTSNNFDTDEVFKTWTAGKVEQGIKYYVGQHGNNYGTWTYSQEMPELTTPDKFISWGWESDNLKIVPAFIFNTLSKRNFTCKKDGGILLIERCLHSPQTTFDNHYENIIYQEEQFRFVNFLPLQIKSELTVRLHLHKPSNLVWSDKRRWEDFDSNIKLELGQQKIWNVIRQNRIIIYSYDSTGILETLSLNIPTIGFWHGLVEEILPSAIPFYKRLQEVGILFESPEDAAAHISKHWDNIDKWWFSSKVQDARVAFCNRFAKSETYPIRVLKKILTGNT